MVTTFHTCIWEEPSSYLGWHISYPDSRFILLSPSRQMPSQYLDQAITTSFQKLWNSLFKNHPTLVLHRHWQD